MTINLLVNAGIPAGGWTNLLPWNNLTNQQPLGFHIHISVPGEELDSADSYTGADDSPVVTTATTVPECVHIHKSQLPADEQLGAEHALILKGEWVYNLFASAGPFSADIYAWVRAPADGELEVNVPVQVHYNPKPGGDGSPGAAVWRLWVYDAASRWYTFGDGFTDRVWQRSSAVKGVAAGEVVTIRLQVESRSEAGIDFFTDLEAWRADFTPDAEPLPVPEPEPDPEAVDYEVVVNLLPQDATKAEKAYVLERRHESRETILQSADDAARLVAPGADGSLVRVWDPHRWPGDEDAIGDWLEAHGVDLVEYWYLLHPEPIPDPEPPSDPEPDPPPPDDEPQYTLRSNNLIGLHSGFPRAQSDRYILESGTTIQKYFNAGNAYEAAKMAPGIISVWRKYVGNEQGRIWEKPTIRESAQWYLDLYTAEIETARRNMGLTLAQFLERKIALESLNETIPTYNIPVLEACVEFDVNFSQLAHSRYGDAIDIVLLCGAIGNPHESEVPLLLPAASQAARWGDFLGYHCYWTANRDRQFINEHWIYHAGRWTEWDTYFRSQGVYPRYASGEAGIVYAWDGVTFDSGKGWKACGSFERYLETIDKFNSNCLAWNAKHGNRYAGGTLFGYGNWGWSNFELGDGEVILLNEWSKTL